MRVVSALKELSSSISSFKVQENSIGFVPTMGALHDGHLALIDQSLRENDKTVVSIFVNPLQFNNSEDLEKYPRVMEEDLCLLEEKEISLVFTPDQKEFYPSKPLVSIDFGPLAQVLEGKFRKNHFEGVGIVVSKLLHLVQPTNAYFGLKDLQQYLLIKRMCYDHSFPSNIVGVETVRETSGLALSSRNRRLSSKGLQIAPIIYKGLQSIRLGLERKESLESLLIRAEDLYRREDGFELEYLEAVDPSNLQKVKEYDQLNELAVCVAGYVEGIRLIDNLYLRLK